VAHVPGLKVALPATPYDAKGLLKAAIRDDGPVVVFEDKMMFATKGPVPAGEYTLPFGVADVKREGEDVTLVATSSMVYVALEAAEELERDGVSAEVVDPRTLVPLDREALVESAKKTGRAIVIDEGHESFGASAELAAVIAEGAFYHLDAPVTRAAAMDVPIPFSPVLEDQTVPTAEGVFRLAKSLLGKA
jgi:pyruvate dehydrogenase E1 component beta subunit